MAGPISKLEAVNRILLSIGEQPVSSLTVSGVIEVAVAKTTLDDTIREVLSRGWHFNTDRGVELLPDNNKNILVPSTALSIDTVGDSAVYDVTLRASGSGFILWDTRNHTDEFDEPVVCDIVYELDWEDLPQVVRWYMTVKAARRFAENVTQSAVLYQFTAKDEEEALAAIKEQDADNADYNLFTESWLPFYTTRREDAIL